MERVERVDALPSAAASATFAARRLVAGAADLHRHRHRWPDRACVRSRLGLGSRFLSGAGCPGTAPRCGVGRISCTMQPATPSDCQVLLLAAGDHVKREERAVPAMPGSAGPRPRKARESAMAERLVSIAQISLCRFFRCRCCAPFLVSESPTPSGKGSHAPPRIPNFMSGAFRMLLGVNIHAALGSNVTVSLRIAAAA